MLDGYDSFIKDVADKVNAVIPIGDVCIRDGEDILFRGAEMYDEFVTPPVVPVRVASFHLVLPHTEALLSISTGIEQRTYWQNPVVEKVPCGVVQCSRRAVPYMGVPDFSVKVDLDGRVVSDVYVSQVVDMTHRKPHTERLAEVAMQHYYWRNNKFMRKNDPDGKLGWYPKLHPASFDEAVQAAINYISIPTPISRNLESVASSRVLDRECV